MVTLSLSADWRTATQTTHSMGAGCSSRRRVTSGILNDFPSFKIVLVGDSEVGKTSIFMRYVRNQFDYDYRPTVSVCIGNVVKKVNVPRDAIVSVALWDLPGREEVDLRKSYYKNIDAAIVVVDISCRDSIESGCMWKQDILSNAILTNEDADDAVLHGSVRRRLSTATLNNIPVLLLGNKFDKLDYDPQSDDVPAEVTALETHADESGFAGSVAVSARDGDSSVHNAVQALIRHLVEIRTAAKGMTRQMTQPMEGLRKIGGTWVKSKDVRYRLNRTKIDELDALFDRCEPSLGDVDSTTANFHGSLSRFRRQCAVCRIGVGPNPSLEDCVTALKEALGDDGLEVTNVGPFPQLLIPGALDRSLDIQVAKAVEMYRLEIVPHAEKVLGACPVAEAVFSGVVDEILQVQERLTDLGTAAGLSKNGLREAEAHLKANLDEIRQNQVRAARAVQSVESAAQKVKAAMLWNS
ncbi:uncharacterized protein [Oscarella lobularis]|uniref:uncharacterized protein n=1 Tax=Oscarella lobularis TaxID=121494 RepID=UPI00331443E5